MCPDLDKSTLKANTCCRDDNSGSNLLLPVMEVVIVYDDRIQIQSPYRLRSLLDVLNGRADTSPTFVMKTFLGSAQKSLKELKLLVKLPDCVCSIPFLVDRDMSLTFKAKELSNAEFNTQAKWL